MHDTMLRWQSDRGVLRPVLRFLAHVQPINCSLHLTSAEERVSLRFCGGLGRLPVVARLKDCTGWQHHGHGSREVLVDALLCGAVHCVVLVLRGWHLYRTVGQGNRAGLIDGNVPLYSCVGLLAALEV